MLRFFDKPSCFGHVFFLDFFWDFFVFCELFAKKNFFVNYLQKIFFCKLLGKKIFLRSFLGKVGSEVRVWVSDFGKSGVFGKVSARGIGI